MHQSRRISEQVAEDLNKKMVFIAGPRQCGKTTLAKSLAKNFSHRYYNWDEDTDRKLILQSKLDMSKELWLLDELHKYRNWRNWLKGKFDTYRDQNKILVTGSAKLDVYNRGGDSLQGRYFFHRLHPFTLAELLNTKLPKEIESLAEMKLKDINEKDAQTFLDDLFNLGGFPEPLFSGSQRQANRWRSSYGARLIREDIRDLEKIINLDKIELLYNHLPKTIGSTLSINSIREDLEVSFESIRDWIKIFENLYICFRLAPLGGKKILNNIRAVKKEQKLYFWDWGVVDEPAAKFENLIALHLLRTVHFFEDVHGIKTELRYFRDTRGHEVDFIVVKNGKPWMAIEVKLSEQGLDPNLKYFIERIKIPYAFQVHLNGKKHYRLDNINDCKITCLPASTFLANLI